MEPTIQTTVFGFNASAYVDAYSEEVEIFLPEWSGRVALITAHIQIDQLKKFVEAVESAIRAAQGNVSEGTAASVHDRK